MYLRQVLEKNRAIVAVASILAILVAGYVIYQQTAGTYAGSGQPGFFSDDDGKTWFAADIKGRIPPFDHDGKTAVRCYLYQCGSETFVAYLERYKPEYHKEAAKLANADKMTANELKAADAKLRALGTACREIKKPGAKDWITMGAPSFADTVMVKCKDGSSPELVRP